MISAGRRDGGLDETAGELLGNVFRLDDRKVASVMTPANDIIFLDLQAPSQANLEKIKTHSVSRFLVCKGGLSQVMGYIESRELLQHLLTGNQLDLGKLPTHAIQFMPNTQSLIGVLEFFRTQKTPLAIVVNEFGGRRARHIERSARLCGRRCAQLSGRTAARRAARGRFVAARRTVAAGRDERQAQP